MTHMKPSTVANHERHLRAEAAKRNKIALDALRELVYTEMRPIVLALIEKAKTGDHKTAELLFDRTFGKSKESLEVTGEVKFSLVSLAEQWAAQQKRAQDEQNLLVAPSESSPPVEEPSDRE